MKNLYFVFLFIFSLMNSVSGQRTSLELKLFELPDVVFEKIQNNDTLYTSYLLRVKQPIDHKDVNKGYFYQKVYLSHIDFDNPMVIITQGYNRNRAVLGELALMLNANQLDVEHRYFGESIPENMDYDYLNLEQATADLHRINVLFKELYNSNWISTGISKGGATTIFYRYFYPNDVDVSVPYVAPINRAFEDKRLYEFLDDIGSDECRNRIRKFQKRLLTHREEVLPLLEMYSKGARLKYNYISSEEAFEYTVLEFPFSFWQYGNDCEQIIGDTSTMVEAVSYLLDISNMGFFSDRDIEAYGSHYYQSAEEMGYYGYRTHIFKDLIKALPVDENPHATFSPGKIKIEFDGSLLEKVNKWLEHDANQMIYINGALDTWSATAVPKNDKVDALWFFMEGKHHANARINNMSVENKKLISETLDKWLSK